LLMDGEEMSNLYRGPFIYRCILPCFVSFGKVVTEEKIFRSKHFYVICLYTSDCGKLKRKLSAITIRNLVCRTKLK